MRQEVGLLKVKQHYISTFDLEEIRCVTLCGAVEVISGFGFLLVVFLGNV